MNLLIPYFASCDILMSFPVFYHYRFICKNNGVLFENDLLQIGVKAEFRQNLGRIGLYYGNKTSFPFVAFMPEVVCPPHLQSHILFNWSMNNYILSVYSP